MELMELPSSSSSCDDITTNRLFVRKLFTVHHSIQNSMYRMSATFNILLNDLDEGKLDLYIIPFCPLTQTTVALNVSYE